MHSLIWRQRNLQTHPKPRLVCLGARHACIRRDENTSEVFDRACHGKPIRVSCRRFVEKKIEFRAYRQPKTLPITG